MRHFIGSVFGCPIVTDNELRDGQWIISHQPLATILVSDWETFEHLKSARFELVNPAPESVELEAVQVFVFEE